MSGHRIQFSPPARPVGGIDHAKLERIRADLDMKRAALDGALRLMHEHRDVYQAEKLQLETGMSAAGHQMWVSRDEAELLTWSAHDQTDGRVDVPTVRRCIVLKQRWQRVQERVAVLNAEIGPLATLTDACERHIQGL
jgi:hypothetical protein